MCMRISMCVCVVGPSVQEIFVKRLSLHFRLYFILEVYISFRRSYLIRILIHTGFFKCHFMYFLKPISFEVGVFI